MSGRKGKGPRFDDRGGEPAVEGREYAIISESPGSNGRSTYTLRCPFCQGRVVAYVWSLAGGGKRCPCGALFGGRGLAYHWEAVPAQ